MSSERNALHCPECGDRIRDKVPAKMGQVVTCRGCGTRLEVVALGPIELDLAFEYDGWDDEDEDDDSFSWGDEEDAA